MGWEDCHLHDFTIKRQRYALPSVEDLDGPADESETRLCDVVRSRSKFLYQYDLGDSWNHVLIVEKILHDDDATGPVCVDGERACPPEDSGGPWGYTEKLQALSDPDDEASDELREWMGADFDSELFQRDSVNTELNRIFRSTRKRRRSILQE
jgi:hypothetical protein